MSGASIAGPAPFATAREWCVAVPALIGLSWAAAVALAVARSLMAGAYPHWDVLAAMPGSEGTWTTWPIMAICLLADRWARNARGSAARSPASAYSYDLFFALADATGAMHALEILFTCGIALWAGAYEPHSGWIMAALPMWAQVPIAYLIMNFLIYWTHRAMHTTLLWPLHALHHAAPDMSPLTDSRQHPIDNLTTLPAPFVMIWLGCSPEALFCAAMLGQLQAALQHSHIPFPWWVERWVFSGARGHRVHHSVQPEHYNRNFSFFVPWDRLFGTFVLPADAMTLRTGVLDPRFRVSTPWRDMVSTTRIWLRGLRGR